jgi:uncharacterized protein (TIGR02246 family)
MQGIDAALAEMACRRAITAYCLAADRHDLAGFLNVFTADAVWERPGKGELRGHQQIAAFFQDRPKDVTTCHVSSNALIEVIGVSIARATSLATVYRRDGNAGAELAAISPTSVIEYSDEFKKDADGEWRIASRRTRTIFRAAS